MTILTGARLRGAPWLIAFCATLAAPATAQTADDRPTFEARGILVISDGDMVSAAYNGAPLGESVGDALSYVDLRNGIARPAVTTVPASNGVPGAPGALAVSADGTRAYVAEGRSAPGDEAAAFRDLAPGQLLQAFDISDPANLVPLNTVALPREPDTVSISSDGTWLAAALSADRARTPGAQMALVPLQADGSLGTPLYLPLPGVPDTVFARRFVFHPDRLAVAALLSEEDEVRFFDLDLSGDSPALVPWGNPVGMGKFPYTGRFTPDGRHFLVAELNWGRDVPGRGAEAPTGSIALIRVASTGDDARLDGQDGRVFVPPRDRGLHARVALAEGMMNPEGLEISPDGRFAIATSIENSWLRKDDPRYTPYATATLIEIDGAGSRLIKHDDVVYYGELPEGAAFDATSENLFLISYADPSDSGRDGALHHFRVVETRRGLRLAPTDIVIPVRRGAHYMVPIFE